MFGYYGIVWMFEIMINEEFVYKCYKYNYVNLIEMN